jgi:hypothetical protein
MILKMEFIFKTVHFFFQVETNSYILKINNIRKIFELLRDL